MTTGQKIQALRKQRGLTQEQLAQRLGGLPAGGVPLGAGRVPAGDRQPASPGRSSGRVPRHPAGPSPGAGGPRPQGRTLRSGGAFPHCALPESAPQTAALAVSPAGGAGGFCRLGPVAAGQCPLPGADPPDPGALAVLFTVPAPFGDLFPGVGHPVLQAADPPAQIKYPWEAGPINEPQLPRGFFTLLWWRAAPTPGLGTAGPPCRRSPGPRHGRGAPLPARRPDW